MNNLNEQNQAKDNEAFEGSCENLQEEEGKEKEEEEEEEGVSKNLTNEAPKEVDTSDHVVTFNMKEEQEECEECEDELEDDAKTKESNKRKPSFGSSSGDSLGNSTTYSTSSSTSNVHQKEMQNFKLKNKAMKKKVHFEISWNNLDYVVTSNWYDLTKQRKPILNNLSGSFKSGELSAVLGPSGAGKSTFIDCLLGKRERGLTGNTRVTFESKTEELERRKSRPLKIATIPQEDHLMESLTVMETFMFASKIKNAHLQWDEEEEDEDDDDEKCGKVERKRTLKRRKPFDHFANVQRVIQQLNLSSCASLRCGSLSGGQYKRVSIGQELLSRPDLMILDEPTSGLDSVTCFQTVNALRQLIENSPYPMAIVATIHQPDIEVFELFHKTYVLASGGRAIYEGPSNMILNRVHLALDEVETRRKVSKFDLCKSSLGVGENNLASLRAKLEPGSKQFGRLNPARLIVELAANEYGFEICKEMNELQMRDCQYRLSGSFISEIKANQMNYESKERINKEQKLCTASTSSSSSIDCCCNYTIDESEQTHESKSNLTQQQIYSTYSSTNKPFDYELNNPERRKPELDKLLCLVSANVNQKRSCKIFFKHLFLHCNRSWITIIRDPMLFSLQVVLHIFVPLLISYSFQGYRGDACPKIGPLDVIEEAYRKDGGNILDDLQRELRVVFENLGYMFFQIYVIIFAAVCVTSLTYPLIMHVLLKEYRNGWYSLSSYFVGRTIADLPVPTFNVFLAMAISYHLTGQPMSPYGWRFLSVASITCLATLVAQTQGLMFGALLMNMPQSAVFVAPASTAPLVVVSGFLIRIQNLPTPLQILSKFSYFTHLLNGFIVARYGFNRCPCNEDHFQLIDPAREIPNQARTLINIWVDTFANDDQILNNNNVTASKQIDLVGNLVDTITKAKTFGYQLTECNQVKPFTMLDYQLEDYDLLVSFVILIGMLIIFRWLTYITLSWKISSSI